MSDDVGRHAPRPVAPEHEYHPGGDPACWVGRVCVACGALGDGAPPPVCPRCGTPREPDQD